MSSWRPPTNNARSMFRSCGFRVLASLVTREAALKGRKSSFGSERVTRREQGASCRTIGVLLLLSTILCGTVRAEEPVYDIDIPSMNAAEALNRFAEQTGAIMLFSYDLANARRTSAVRGRYTLLEGLDLLLRGTGLSGGLSDKRVVNISQGGNVQRTGEEPPVTNERASFRKKLAAFFTSMLAASAASTQEADNGIEEIVVTAQKRTERLADVPVPVTAIDAGALATQSQVLLRDYYATVPGLTVAPGVQSNQTVAIRGITTGTGNPTVAILIDDVPYGAATNIGGGRFIPEIDPGDLARIEVLRGPQGTLYGASSLGGLLKFVTRDPSTDDLSGSLQAGMSDVQGGDDPGYSLRGSVNVPLNDAWAVRASAFTRRDAGYIDNVRTAQEDVNETTARGGRLSTLWRPSDTFSLKLTALAQELEEDGQSFDFIALPDLQQSLLAGTGWTERKTQSYTATLTSKIASAELTSLTGYTINKFSGSTDFGNETLSTLR